MYTIKQAATRSGVGVSLLRAWERRYGIVAPIRASSGYRLYDDESISRLRSMRRLVDGGWSASQAAEAVKSGVAEPLDAPRTGASGAHADVEAFLNAAGAYDSVALESVLDSFFARGSYESVIDDFVLPAVAALGTAWATGRIDIGAEHLASATVQRRLAALFDQGGATGTGRTVLVGLPPGSRHEIGVLAFSVALRRQGVNVLYLGPDVPVSSWIHAVTERRPAAVVVGVMVSDDVIVAADVIEAIREANPKVLVAVGGGAAREVASDVHLLADRVARAAVEVAELVGAR